MVITAVTTGKAGHTAYVLWGTSEVWVTFNKAGEVVDSSLKPGPSLERVVSFIERQPAPWKPPQRVTLQLETPWRAALHPSYDGEPCCHCGEPVEYGHVIAFANGQVDGKTYGSVVAAHPVCGAGLQVGDSVNAIKRTR